MWSIVITDWMQCPDSIKGARNFIPRISSSFFLLSYSQHIKAFLHHSTTSTMISVSTTTTCDSAHSVTSNVATSRRGKNGALRGDHETTTESCMASLSLPFKRRLEMASVIIWHCSSFYLMAFFFYNWTRPFLLPLAVLYLIYMVMDRSPERGGRPISWIREWSLWKHMADYFPIQIIKVVKSPFFSLQLPA